MGGPFERTWWVDAGTLLAGPFPGSSSAEGLDRKLGGLLDVGVRSFVSLMEPDERNHDGKEFAPYEQRAHFLARERDESIEFHRFPIRDYGIVHDTAYRRILDTIDTAIAGERPVYLHCWGGHGRTGTVVGCWLRERGMGADDALREIERLRSHDAYLSSMDSPQTDDQRRVVRAWSR